MTDYCLADKSRPKGPLKSINQTISTLLPIAAKPIPEMCLRTFLLTTYNYSASSPQSLNITESN